MTASPPPASPLGPAYGGLEELPHNFATSRLEEVVKWSRARSCWPATFGLACCAIEMMATGGAHYDIARYGMEVFRASPRQADLMIVAGRVSQKMAPVLRQIYDQMMAPKWVISMGVCASSGGMFNNYAIVQGVDQVVPVDVYAPGCPPGPETLLHAILTLHGLRYQRRADASAGSPPRGPGRASSSSNATARPPPGWWLPRPAAAPGRVAPALPPPSPVTSGSEAAGACDGGPADLRRRPAADDSGGGICAGGRRLRGSRRS